MKIEVNGCKDCVFRKVSRNDYCSLTNDVINPNLLKSNIQNKYPHSCPLKERSVLIELKTNNL